jgi:hypothetical protein
VNLAGGTALAKLASAPGEGPACAFSCVPAALASRLGAWAAIAIVALALAGCGTALTRTPVPADQVTHANPMGLPGLRAWGDIIEESEVQNFADRQTRIIEARFGAEIRAGRVPTLHFLAISGGGPDGAFGAGVLKAWSAAGTRPEFFGVAGISTGSILAPFAFLGSDYDATIEEIYTTLKSDDVISSTIVSGIISGASLFDTSGLAAKIAHYVTPELLAKIAAEYRKGRFLLVGTTNLDAGRPVIWNMTAIAAALPTHPEALQLFRDVIRASAAIPIAFPPQMIRVQTPDGKVFDEMHVDGGATSQVTLVQPQLPVAAMTRRALGRNVDRRLWILVNNKVLSEYAPVRPRVGPIDAAAVSSLIRGSGVGDVYKLYIIAQRDDVRFNAAWIPRQTPCTSADGEMFDPAYMRCLFNFAGTLVRAGTLWSTLPPYYVLPPPDTPRRQAPPGRA